MGTDEGALDERNKCKRKPTDHDDKIIACHDIPVSMSNT